MVSEAAQKIVNIDTFFFWCLLILRKSIFFLLLFNIVIRYLFVIVLLISSGSLSLLGNSRKSRLAVLKIRSVFLMMYIWLTDFCVVVEWSIR